MYKNIKTDKFDLELLKHKPIETLEDAHNLLLLMLEEQPFHKFLDTNMSYKVLKKSQWANITTEDNPNPEEIIQKITQLIINMPVLKLQDPMVYDYIKKDPDAAQPDTVMAIYRDYEYNTEPYFYFRRFI